MADDAILVERLLRVIDEGRRVATYKLALLLALIDATAVLPGESAVPTRLIAERVASLYYPQSRPFIATGGIERELRQITAAGSPVLRAMVRLRLVGDGAGCRQADDVRDAMPAEYHRAIDSIEDVFVRYPIPLLQVVGAATIPFLYEVHWSQGTSIQSVRGRGEDQLRLLPGVGDRLAVLGPMLRPLIELHWTRDVARWSGLGIEDQELRRHLFGSERVGFPVRFVADLVELQAGRCFYCGEPLHRRVEVDHFLAWSRWPNDAIENLVVADRCNGAKSDHLAAGVHLERWRETRAQGHHALTVIADRHRWRSDPQRTSALIRTAYSHVAPGTPLWRSGREFDIAIGPLMDR